VCDITKEESWPSDIPPESVDIATMIFVLSAISPEKMRDAITNTAKVGDNFYFPSLPFI